MNTISEAVKKFGRNGVITMKDGKTLNNNRNYYYSFIEYVLVMFYGCEETLQSWQLIKESI